MTHSVHYWRVCPEDIAEQPRKKSLRGARNRRNSSAEPAARNDFFYRTPFGRGRTPIARSLRFFEDVNFLAPGLRRRTALLLNDGAQPEPRNFNSKRITPHGIFSLMFDALARAAGDYRFLAFPLIPPSDFTPRANFRTRATLENSIGSRKRVPGHHFGIIRKGDTSIVVRRSCKLLKRSQLKGPKGDAFRRPATEYKTSRTTDFLLVDVVSGHSTLHKFSSDQFLPTAPSEERDRIFAGHRCLI